MSSLQAFYAGAFSSAELTTTLAQVLTDGNVASKAIDMATFDLQNVGSATVGTVSAGVVVSSGAITGASMATQTLNASSNITTSGSIILTNGTKSISNNDGPLILGTSTVSSCVVNGGIQMQNNCTVKGVLKIEDSPLNCNYLSYSVNNTNPSVVGYKLGENYVVLSVAMNNSSVETLLYQSPLVVPLGVWLITTRVGFSSTDAETSDCSIFFSCGYTQGEIPTSNTQAGIRNNLGYVNFSSVFQSITNLQSPTFVYQSNIANCTVGDISYHLTRIG